MNLTQSDVAVKAGVSRKAVAFALSGNPLLNAKLRPETRQRILQTVQQMGYVPHHAARRLARQQSDRNRRGVDQVGLLFLAKNELDATCLAMLTGAEGELAKFDASVTFTRVAEPEEWRKVERLTRSGVIDCWMLYGAVTDDVIDRLGPGNLPCVVLGDSQTTRPVATVNVDNFAVGRMAAERLAALGHRRIVYWGSNLRFVYQRQTLEGFLDAARRLNLDLDPRLVVNYVPLMDPNAPNSRNVEVVMKRLGECRTSGGDLPTAVFVPEFDVSLFLRRVLQDAGVRVPQDISILGCERAGQPSARNEGFTRVELSMHEVGRQGAVLLNRLVSGEQTELSQHKVLPELAEGWSTSAPRSIGG